MVNNIKNDLNRIVRKNYDTRISRNIMKLQESYSDEQLLFMLSQGTGLRLKDSVVLYYQSNMGYKCVNEDSSKIGAFPMCIQIERTLNNKGEIEVR